MKKIAEMLENQKIRYKWFPVLLLVMSMIPAGARAEVVTYGLTIAQEKVTIADATTEGMTINGRIPGPTLRFKEGDTARILVHNRMAEPTSIHWHGILVPPNMDGVPYVSFPPIQPGSSFTYEFPIRQSGTYWYHSHSSLQEQSGVYGAIVIDPRHQHPNGEVAAEHVVLFSDWTTEDPHKVLRTLKRGSEWYAIEKGSGQSILGAARVDKLGDYVKRELQRMPAMDIADVAYDYFLANGQPETVINAKMGQRLRLRIINGSATTYFHLEFAGGPMTIISADGLKVQPVEQQRFLVAVAETYDVLVNIPHHGAYEMRATAHDGSGYASVWLGNGRRFPAPDVPKPNLYQGMAHGSASSIWALTPAGAMGMPDDQVNSGKFDQPGMAGMAGMTTVHGHEVKHGNDMKPNQEMDHGRHPEPGIKSTHSEQNSKQKLHDMTSAEMDKSETGHSAHAMSKAQDDDRRGKKYAKNFRPFASDVSSVQDIAADGVDPRRPWPPYAKLRAIEPTAFDPEKPIREIRLTLDGDMERYVWFLNNKPLSESDVIRIREGEVARFIMINRTMMHHPMHLHGHFFRVLNGQGDYAPLKHTVDVAPMSTTVIEFYGNEFGDWFFHCHLLYHMKSGMARLVHYDGYKPDPEVVAVQPKLFRESWYFWGEADVLSNMTEGALSLSDTRNIFQASWEAGWQDVDKTDWEVLLTYDRYFNRFFSILVGVDFLGEGSSTEETRGVLGLRYLLPLNFETTAWVDTDGGARVIAEKEFALTPRLSLLGEVEYDTHDKWEGKAGLSYVLTKTVSLLGQWHSEFGWGGGLQVRF
jgi:CopA family copper-resistance protein